MATPPTFVASYGNAAISSTSPKTASVTVQAGDLVVVAAATADAPLLLSAPTGGGLTYTLQQSIVSVPNQANAYVWTATSPSAQTFTMSLSANTNGTAWTWVAYVFRNHGGVGASAKRTATSTTTLNLPTQAANSTIVLLDADWNAQIGTVRTYATSTAGAFTEKSYQYAQSYLTFYSGYYADAGVLATKTVGMTAPSGQLPSLIAVEVLAAPPAVTGSLTMTTTASPASVPPMVTINVSDTRSTSTGKLTVMRNNPDGTTTPVRTTDGNPLQLTSGTGVLYDMEAPYNAPVSYTSLEVPTVTTAQVTLSVSRPWLVHPGTPSLSMPLPTLGKGSFAQRTRPVVRGVFRPMGRANAVVVTDGSRKGVDSSMTLLVQSEQQMAALEALTADASTLLLNIPADSPITFNACYISIGDMVEAPVADNVIETWMTATMPFSVVDRPVGGSQVARTYADVLASFGTYASVLSKYRTYADVLTGP